MKVKEFLKKHLTGGRIKIALVVIAGLIVIIVFTQAC